MMKNNFGKLYIVSTPIGNIKDITFRAIEVLESVDYIVCENPNNSKKLLNHYNINKKLIQLNAIIEENNTSNILNLLKNGNNIAYISDAGTPCISDPGQILVSNAIKENIEVSVIPGASAILTSLAGSGLNISNFTFVGFLSNKSGTRLNQLKELSKINSTLVIYESSHRILDTIKDIKQTFNNDLNICIAKELTKIHEEYIRDKIANISLGKEKVKGEFVILIENKISKENMSDDEIKEKLIKLIKEEKLTNKEAILKISKDYNINKNIVYKLSLDIKK